MADRIWESAAAIAGATDGFGLLWRGLIFEIVGQWKPFGGFLVVIAVGGQEGGIGDGLFDLRYGALPNDLVASGNSHNTQGGGVKAEKRRPPRRWRLD